ncbi:MAG: hypothetical protein R3B71_01150 [Candidatus Gracilibacteria bacterium]|nr:hypothetical protein [Candidatus Peregrinibacteria bacterium]
MDLTSFFKDENGKVVIAQWPNAPLIAWFGTMVATWLPLPETLIVFLDLISFGALFTWAWMEIFSGVNLWRRFLGTAVMVSVLLSKAGIFSFF